MAVAGKASLPLQASITLQASLSLQASITLVTLEAQGHKSPGGIHLHRYLSAIFSAACQKGHGSELQSSKGSGGHQLEKPSGREHEARGLVAVLRELDRGIVVTESEVPELPAACEPPRVVGAG